MSKRDDAIRIRDAAIAVVASVVEIVKIRGQEGSNLRNFAERDGLDIMCSTPSTRLPEVPADMREKLVGVGQPQLPYLLDIWDATKKVFSVTWGEDGQFRIVAFKRGDWEKKLV